ncbi:GNAT family N-acetyltransferase [Alteromonas sp. 5E99-2]|uniref:GNAT family N-acetyltransferase n=1 Tax=Alteromonas sp. 5E99-2 TaxID=2817683 RepID=UPI001A98CD14|nr:GNAT family N-acetyltransferase [Alteromonas sp. 5E99-2]MBO1256333.1 GNAT family N-acetyltransferase [Alteromonas sp. 5E99-2]
MTNHDLFRAASNPDTNVNYLQELSKSPDEVVRAAVASNPSTNQETLLSLVGDSSSHVIENLMETQNKFDCSSYEFARTKLSKLVLAKTEDAKFILSLRENTNLNKFISYVDSDIEKQTQWLSNYKNRERVRAEFYFIIKGMGNESLGTVRLYDFQTGSFCWGSWVVNPGSPRKAAIESALNVYEFAFYVLGFSQSHFDVRNENVKVIEFHKRMGAKVIKSNDLDTFFILKKEEYEATRDTYKKFFIQE